MRWKREAVAIACLSIGATVSVLMGQDANWDLLNYHLSNPHAVLNGRLDIDLDPAGLQSYFNPSLDILYYLMATGPLATHPRLLAAAMGLPYGGLILVTFCLARRLFTGLSGLPQTVIAAAATAAAVTGAGSLSQAGTVFNEVTIAMLVLWGVLVVLPRLDGRPLRRGWRGLAAGGFLFGFAAGLKLTALIFAPALCLALLLVIRLRAGAGLVASFTAGWAAGFLLTVGWWSWRMVARFGNPFFPLFNALFRSPWVQPMDFFDPSCQPYTPLQWIFYPFWWFTWHDRLVNAEMPYRDPRLALALVSLFLVAAGGARGWLQRRGAGSDVTWQPGQRLVFWFLAIAYVLWLIGSANMRYDIVLEVLGTLVFLLVLARLAGQAPGRVRAAAILGAVAIPAAGCIAWTKPPDYGRIAYGPRVFQVDMAWTPPDTLFVAISGPTAYVTVFVPPAANARVVGFSFLNRFAEGWRLNIETAAIVRDSKGPIFVLVPRVEVTDIIPFLPLIGLNPALGPCRVIESNLDHNQTRACEARRL